MLKLAVMLNLSDNFNSVYLMICGILWFPNISIFIPSLSKCAETKHLINLQNGRFVTRLFLELKSMEMSRISQTKGVSAYTWLRRQNMILSDEVSEQVILNIAIYLNKKKKKKQLFIKCQGVFYRIQSRVI